MTTFGPTDEQLAALDLFKTGDSMVIEAGAGTGKTTTLGLLARSTRAEGRYLAFNKAIVVDVQGKMPPNITASTAHSLAFRHTGKRYAHRLNSHRLRSFEIARILGLRSWTAKYGAQSKYLSEGFLAGLVMRAVGRYCQTADERPGPEHVPYLEGIDPPNSDGTRTYRNNDQLRDLLAPAVERAWRDLCDPDGSLQFRHDHYLKLWQLAHPRLDCSFVLFDEAQDANPVMAAVIAEQDHAQRVYVGDSAQAIYEFTGAVNALANIDTAHRRFLTQSFRFGPAIADAANVYLGRLDAPLRLSGFDEIPSTIGPLGDVAPDAVLCRTNATAVEHVLAAQRAGRAAHLVGGGTEVVSFARAARDLMAGERTWHPELACFESWGEVRDYVRDDAQGGELRLLVSLVDEYGVPTILQALDRMPREDVADLIVSTAHKAKGREWRTVQLAGDFADVEQTDAELRLRYVAVTRARLHLDVSRLEQADRDALARRERKAAAVGAARGSDLKDDER